MSAAERFAAYIDGVEEQERRLFGSHADRQQEVRRLY